MEPNHSKHALIAMVLLLAALGAHFGATTIGWDNVNLPGVEFRQAQTAISAYFIQQDNDFSLAYPTPVLGKPWSIPMEYPLYQWSVVGWSNLTGAPLTQSARAISLLCFYLTLPAIWIFLRGLGLKSSQSSIALIPILLCPLYVFYGRAFLIETMALMFSTWFAVGYVETLKRKSWRWWTVVAICGAFAGTVKVTTLIIFLIPCAIWSAVRLLQSLRDRNFTATRQVLLWGLGSIILPGLATISWTQFADSVKAVHPQGAVLTSGAMTQFNFAYGVFDVRFSIDTWRAIYGIIQDGILSPVVGGIVLLIGLIWAGRWRSAALSCLGLFTVAPVIFPLLYAWHDYYFVANTVFLMLFLGFVLAGLQEKRWGGVATLGLLLILSWSQFSTYRSNYYPDQSAVERNGPKISFTIRDLTEESHVIMIVGDDWNSMIPYYAQRRALMIRKTYESNLELIQSCVTELEDETVGLLVLMNEQIDNEPLISAMEERLGISRHHYFAEENARLFPTASVLESLLPEDVRRAHDASPLKPAYYSISHRFADKTLDASILTERTRAVFDLVNPIPTRFYFQFGPGLVDSGTKQVLNAHTTTRLWFDLPAGDHRLTMSGGLMEGAWNRDEFISDGISLSLRTENTSGEPEIFFDHYLNPLEVPDHRGEQDWSVEFTLREPSTLRLEVGPGPAGNGGTDWFYFSGITID